MSEHILTEKRDGVLEIRIHRPKKKNALQVAMYGAIADALEQASGDDEVRVVYLTGSEGVFTAGNDLMDFMNPAEAIEQVIRFLTGIATLEKPLVAGVNGLAIGVGVTMLLHCDLVYASEEATFKTPFVDLGLVPEAASSYLMPLMMGHQQAARMLLMGEEITAQGALAYGFVSEVHPDEDLPGVARQKAEALARRAPEAVKATKALMKRCQNGPVKEAMEAEGEVFKERLMSPELMEAVQAFMQKREPDFSSLSG